jgi:hypothetical protein
MKPYPAKPAISRLSLDASHVRLPRTQDEGHGRGTPQLGSCTYLQISWVILPIATTSSAMHCATAGD